MVRATPAGPDRCVIACRGRARPPRPRGGAMPSETGRDLTGRAGPHAGGARGAAWPVAPRARPRAAQGQPSPLRSSAPGLPSAWAPPRSPAQGKPSPLRSSAPGLPSAWAPPRSPRCWATGPPRCPRAASARAASPGRAAGAGSAAARTRSAGWAAAGAAPVSPGPGFSACRAARGS